MKEKHKRPYVFTLLLTGLCCYLQPSTFLQHLEEDILSIMVRRAVAGDRWMPAYWQAIGQSQEIKSSTKPPFKTQSGFQRVHVPWRDSDIETPGKVWGGGSGSVDSLNHSKPNCLLFCVGWY